MTIGKASRREFLRTSAALTAGAALVALPALAQARGGANERVRVGICGLGGRGSSHLKALHELAGENVEVAALCDCYTKSRGEAAEAYEKLSGKKVAQYEDMRKMLENESIDAVSFATPNHWHVLGAIWACQAGKDVYLEKPGSQNLAEGRKLVEAARKYQRMVQHGTQCRSSPNIREAIDKLKEGVIGRPYMARIVNYKLREKSLGRSEPATVPEGLNWDMWVGPAPLVPFSTFAWRRANWRWDFGVGDIGNQGVHQLDLVRWGLRLDAHPTKVQAMGGNFFHTDDDCECPNTLAAAFTYDDRKLLVTCETRDGFTNSEAGLGIEYPFVDHHNVVGVIFYGTDGYMILPDYSSYYTFLGEKRTPGPSKTLEGNPMMDVDHFRNWIQAVRSRKAADLNAEILEGHMSTSLVHLANIAYRVGKTVEFDPQAERFVSDEEANALLGRRKKRPPYVIPNEI
jgi:predicted dehydrogenase